MNIKNKYLTEAVDPTVSISAFSVSKPVREENVVCNDAPTNEDAVSDEDVVGDEDAVTSDDAMSGNDVVSNEDQDKSDAEDAQGDLLEMKTLRATTSPHDDWLHRGPYLYELPFPHLC